jgi:hypothetical protein
MPGGEGLLWKPIEKHPDSWAVRPNLLDYDEVYASFSWDEMRFFKSITSFNL